MTIILLTTHMFIWLGGETQVQEAPPSWNHSDSELGGPKRGPPFWGALLRAPLPFLGHMPLYRREHRVVVSHSGLYGPAFQGAESMPEPHARVGGAGLKP